MCCAVLCVVVSGPHTNLYVRCGTNTLRTRRRTSWVRNRYDIHTIDFSFLANVPECRYFFLTQSSLRLNLLTQVSAENKHCNGKAGIMEGYSCR